MKPAKRIWVGHDKNRYEWLFQTMSVLQRILFLRIWFFIGKTRNCYWQRTLKLLYLSRYW